MRWARWGQLLCNIVSLGEVLELVIKQPHSGNLQGYFLPSVRDQGTVLVIEGPAGALAPRWICIPRDHGIILNLCLINSLENLTCCFKVARIGFSGFWRCLLPSLHTFYFRGGGRGWCFVISLETWSFWWIHCALWAGKILAYSENFIPILFPRAISAISDVIFINLKPIPVTGPTGFVFPWFKSGCYTLPRAHAVP